MIFYFDSNDCRYDDMAVAVRRAIGIQKNKQQRQHNQKIHVLVIKFVIYAFASSYQRERY